jgi:hypothetical protein
MTLWPGRTRTCASVVLDSERNERPPPEQSAAVRRLEAALAKDPRSAGEPVSLVIQIVGWVWKRGLPGPSITLSTTSSESSEKKIVFLRSGNRSSIAFRRGRSPGTPNTIFLDADGHGMFLRYSGTTAR